MNMAKTTKRTKAITTPPPNAPAIPASGPATTSAPPKKGMPWWAWCLISCFVLSVIALVALFFLGKLGADFLKKEGGNIVRRADIDMFKTGIEGYYAEKNEYPDYEAKSIYEIERLLPTYFPQPAKSYANKEDYRACYSRMTKTTYLLYMVPESVSAPSKCQNSLPSGAEDYSQKEPPSPTPPGENETLV